MGKRARLRAHVHRQRGKDIREDSAQGEAVHWDSAHPRGEAAEGRERAGKEPSTGVVSAVTHTHCTTKSSWLPIGSYVRIQAVLLSFPQRARLTAFALPCLAIAVSVDEPTSDEEVGAGLDGSSEGTSTAAGEAALSPASKRARKRAVAARNKRLAKEQKEGVTTPPPSKTENGSSSVLPPPPPTFVEAQSSSSIEARLDAPFLQQQQKPLQSVPSSAAKKPEMQRVPTMVDDGASSFSTDFEDTSLLVDGDSSSSSSTSEDEQEARLDGQQQQQQRQFEPATPRASSRTFTTKATAALQSTAHGALESVSKSNAVPDAVNEQAEEAQDAVEQDEKTAAALGASQKPVDHGSDHDPTKKWKSIITRTVWTLIMIAGFAGISTL